MIFINNSSSDPSIYFETLQTNPYHYNLATKNEGYHQKNSSETAASNRN